MNKRLVKVGMVIECKHAPDVKYLVTKVDKKLKIIYVIGNMSLSFRKIPIDILYCFNIYGRYTKEQLKEMFDQ